MAASLAEAVALKDELLGSQNRAQAPTRQRFVDYVEQWMALHHSRLSPSTRDRYLGSLAHAAVAFGEFYVDSLKASDIRSWVHEQAKIASPATVNGWLRVLRVALDDAVEDGVLETNPARVVKALAEGRTKGPRGRGLGVDEFRRFLAAANDLQGKELSEDISRLLQTLAWTGMRKGEALALRWSDVVDGEIHVVRSVWHRQEKPTKTDDPRRVTVVAPLAAIFEEQRRWLFSTQHPGLASGLVFPASPRHARAGASRRGAEELTWYRGKTALDKPLAKVVREAGVPAISIHSLRRTWEDILRQAGVDQLVRRALAGWRTETAQEIYATVDRSERDAAADAVVGLVMGGMA